MSTNFVMPGMTPTILPGAPPTSSKDDLRKKLQEKLRNKNKAAKPSLLDGFEKDTSCSTGDSAIKKDAAKLKRGRMQNQKGADKMYIKP